MFHYKRDVDRMVGCYLHILKRLRLIFHSRAFFRKCLHGTEIDFRTREMEGHEEVQPEEGLTGVLQHVGGKSASGNVFCTTSRRVCAKT